MSEEYVTCGCGAKVKKIARYELDTEYGTKTFAPEAGLALHALSCSEADKLL